MSIINCTTKCKVKVDRRRTKFVELGYENKLKNQERNCNFTLHAASFQRLFSGLYNAVRMAQCYRYWVHTQGSVVCVTDKTILSL